MATIAMLKAVLTLDDPLSVGSLERCLQHIGDIGERIRETSEIPSNVRFISGENEQRIEAKIADFDAFPPLNHRRLPSE